MSCRGVPFWLGAMRSPRLGTPPRLRCRSSFPTARHTAWPPRRVRSPLFSRSSVNSSGRSSGLLWCQHGVSSHQGLISFSPHSVTVLRVRKWCVWYHPPPQIISSSQGLRHQRVLKIWNSCKHNRKLLSLFPCISHTQKNSVENPH